MNDVFGANPIKLYQVGRSTYSEVSAAYAEATRKIHGVAAGVDGARLGRIYSEVWSGLRDDIQNCLAESADIYLDVGKALVIAADAYGFKDDDNAVKLLKTFESSELPFPSEPDLKVKRPGEPA